MSLNIQAEYDEAYECFQGVLVSLAKYFNYEYELMFASSWGFDICPSNPLEEYCSFGYRLKSCEKVSFLELIQKYHGISVIKKEVNTVSALEKIVKSELEKGLPVTLAIDSFWCSWTYTYKKYHYDHVILITAINVKDKFFQCIDPYYSNKTEKIYFNEIEGNFEECNIFELGEPFIKDITWYKVVGEALLLLKYNDEQSAFNNIRFFADEFEEKLDLKLEIQGYDTLYAAPLFVQLKRIRAFRLTFSKTLQYLSKKYRIVELQNSASQLKSVADLWSRLSIILIKMTMIPQPDILRKRAAELIREIADFEENIACKLVQTIYKHLGADTNG